MLRVGENHTKETLWLILSGDGEDGQSNDIGKCRSRGKKKKKKKKKKIIVLKAIQKTRVNKVLLLSFFPSTCSLTYNICM